MPALCKRKILTLTQFDELSQYLEKQPCCQQGNHTFKHTIAWMRAHRIADLEANLEKFVDLAAMCDCDLLEWLTDETFEAKRGEPLQGPTIHGPVKWQATIMGLLLEAS